MLDKHRFEADPIVNGSVTSSCAKAWREDSHTLKRGMRFSGTSDAFALIATCAMLNVV